MKHRGRFALCLAGVAAMHTGAQAVTADSPGNPYSGIVVRNVFALKPAPAPLPAVDTTVTPPQKIVLTGIVKAFGKKQVFFKTPMAAKPGEAQKDTSFMLSEGERAGEVEILEINELTGTVRVKNHNLEQSLSLEKDGMKPQAFAGGAPGALSAVPGVAGLSGAPGKPINAGIAAPAGSVVTTFGAGGGAAVQRPLRTAPATPTPSGYATATSGYATPTGVPGVSGQNEAKSLSDEEQVVLMEIQRKVFAKDEESGLMPPSLPPPRELPP